MNNQEAVNALLSGKKVRHTSWINEPDLYMYHDEILGFMNANVNEPHSQVEDNLSYKDGYELYKEDAVTTIKEMEKRWSACPPFLAREMLVFGPDSKFIKFKINQDTIQEILEYLDAAKEAMNG